MQETKIRKVAQYVGIGAAVLVPALVVGQDIERLNDLNLGDNALLRGEDIRILRGSLATAVGRINDLEGRLNSQGAALSKTKIRPDNTTAVSVAPGAIGTARASCDEPGDIAIGCSCGGDTGQGTSGSSQIDQRIFVTSNPSGDESSCTCQGQNVGTNQNQRIVAIVSCLRP